VKIEGSEFDPISETYTFTSRWKIKKYYFKWISKRLINFFGKDFIKKAGDLLIITAAISFFYLGFGFSEDSIVQEESEPLFTFNLILLIVSGILAYVTDSTVKYTGNTYCTHCGKNFTCSEVKEPVMKEISTPTEYRVTIIRYWKCNHCEQVDRRECPEGITARKGDKESEEFLKKLKCKNCGKKYSIEEFKRCDIKDTGDKRITRSYYRCRLCGYKDFVVSTDSSVYAFN
jgi:hypothetical protein